MIFISIWSIWFLSEILLNVLFRSGKKDKKGQDKGSIRFLWICVGIGNFLGVIFFIFSKFPISNLLMVRYLGLLLILVGMTLRFGAILSLGRLFTVDVTIRENHSIKKDGAYRIVRHPMYFAMLLSFVGFGISLNNWVSLFFITFLILIALLNRIRIEEKLLIKQFGLEYLEYKKRTYRLIPFVY